MSTEANPAPEDHLRHPAQRQRGAPRAVRGRAGQGARDARRLLPELRRWRRARRRRHVREADPDRRLGHGHVRQGHPQGRPGRDRGRPPGVPGLGSPAVAGAGRAPAQGRRRHQRTPDGVRRAALDGGRQEPARGARRRRGDGRPHPLVVRHDGAQPRLRRRHGQPRRRGRPHPLGAQAVRRVGRHQPVQLPVRAVRRPGRRRARGRQHRRLQAVLRRAAVRRLPAPGDARRGRAGRRVQHGHGPGRDRRRRDPDEPRRRRGHLHRLVRGRLRAVQELRQELPQAGHRRDGRQEPGDRVAPRRPRRGGRGIMRSAFGFSGQKCSANSRVYVERPVHDELVRRLVEKTEAITIGDPTDRVTGSARSSTPRRSPATSRPSRTPGATAGWRSAASE